MTTDNTFEELIDKLQDRLQRVGCHVVATAVMGAPDFDSLTEQQIEEWDPTMMSGDVIVDHIKSESGHFVIGARIHTQDLAWTSQVLDAEVFAADQEMEVLLPTKAELIAEYVKGELADGVPLAEISIPQHLKDLPE